MDMSNENIKENSLHSFFGVSLMKYPNNIALNINKNTWTYKDIESKAQKWAGAINQLVGNSPKRIGIFAYRSEVSYISILSILYSGAAFVPLNPNHSKERIRSIIEQADLDCIFIDSPSLDSFINVTNYLSKIPPLLIPDSSNSISIPNTKIFNQLNIDKCSAINNVIEVSGESIAYILFTSGSTGVPKGVPITHKNLVSYIEYNKKKYDFSHKDRFSQTFDQTFDLSIFDLFMAWSSGASVYSLSPMQLLSPATFINENKITVWFSVPSVATLLHKRGLLKKNAFPTLRWSLFCGEALSYKIVKLWESSAPNSIIENLYGPTELTISCAAHRWDPIESSKNCINGIVPIGKIYENLDNVLIDNNLNISPNDEGELCIAGSQTFSGYWKNKEITSEKFLKINKNGVEQVYYRTGDLVRRLSNGEFAYIGRLDNQVKVNGYRIELGEIEGVLRMESNVIEAVVVGWPIEDENIKGLVAFITVNNSEDLEFEGKLRKFLPPYMIPKQIHIIEEFPLNVNGKIDRKKLVENFR